MIGVLSQSLGPYNHRYTIVIPNFFTTTAPQLGDETATFVRQATIVLHEFKAHGRLRCLTGTPQKALKRLVLCQDRRWPESWDTDNLVPSSLTLD